MPRARRACSSRFPSVRRFMSTQIHPSTSVVNLGPAEDVDHGTHDMHYVPVSTLKERLQKVLDDGLVENASRWSEAAGLTRIHVNKLLKSDRADRGHVELVVLTKLAAVARVSPAWLAYGVGGPNDDPPIGTLLLKLASMPGLRDAVERHPERWRTSTIARACLEPPFKSDSSGRPEGGWEAALDSLEDKTRLGKGADVIALAKRRVGRRPKLPRHPP